MPASLPIFAIFFDGVSVRSVSNGTTNPFSAAPSHELLKVRPARARSRAFLTSGRRCGRRLNGRHFTTFGLRFLFADIFHLRACKRPAVFSLLNCPRDQFSAGSAIIAKCPGQVNFGERRVNEHLRPATPEASVEVSILALAISS